MKPPGHARAAAGQTPSRPASAAADVYRQEGLLLVLVRLRPGVDRGQYERFTAEVDRPGVLRHYRSIRSWQLYRLVDPGPLPYQYVEVAVSDDLDQLRRDMSTPAAAALVRQARYYIEEPEVLVARQAV